MSKKLIAIPQGNLMRVAATKSVTTLIDLKEKTRVDRKTLRAINEGKQVKETTLQSIADRLRVPLAHLLGPSSLDNVSAVPTDGFREIKLPQLDPAALRKIAGETSELNWFLKIDQMSEELEALLLKLRESLRGWFLNLPVEQDVDNLFAEISYIKKSADIDKCVEELAQHDLRIFGGSYVVWDKQRLSLPYKEASLPYDVDRLFTWLKYTSRLRAALSIAPDKSNSTVRVYPGSEPPQKFVEDELAGIDSVEIDGATIWSRATSFSEQAKQFGLTDDNEIPF